MHPRLQATLQRTLIWLAIEDIVRAGHAERGDLLLVVAGSPEQTTGAATDVLRIVRVE